MTTLPSPATPPAPDTVRQRLQRQVLVGLPLVDWPFDALGATLGLDGEAVIDLLQQWVGQGRIARIGLVFSDAGPPRADALDEALVAACASGLPLLRQPWEAIGAMLGVPACRVQTRLGDWMQSGRLRRIAALPALPAPPAP